MKKFANFDWPKECRSWVFESGVGWFAKNRTYITGGLSRALYARVWRGNLGARLPQKKNRIWDWRRCNFLLSCGDYSHSSLFVVDILSRFQFLPHATFRISVQIWTNYETFQNVRTPRPPACPSVIVRHAVLSRQNGISWRLARSKGLAACECH